MRIDRKHIKDSFPLCYSILRFVLKPYFRCLGFINRQREICLIKRAPILQRKALQELERKSTIRCVFMAIFPQVWKYDDVYRIMEGHPRFEPIILVCPRIDYGKEAMLETLNDCYWHFKAKGYNVIKSFDEQHNTYVVLDDLSPDILFYTNPYKGLIDDRYYVTKNLRHLTVYVPYMFGNNNDVAGFHDLLLHNVVWRFYAESLCHKDYSIASSRCKGRNVVVSGYPGIERFIDQTYIPSKDDWKIKSNDLKRIIWAPHHTISPVGNVNYSCFLQFSDIMLSFARKYSSQVQFVFKPHPLLRDKLNQLWGKDKTDWYYNQWLSLDNCNVNNGEYIDLFLTSDAMIHACGSFIVEYLYVNKPVMRTLNAEPIDSMFNSFASKCLDYYYFARSEQDIESFIQNVINGIDPLSEQRTKFLREVLMPHGSPSQNIVDDIIESIDNQILYRD